MKQLKCPSCGAANAIPATGLEVVCEYCGFSRPVPDADKRREQQAKEVEAQRRAEERAQRRAEERARRLAERKQQAKEARFRWLGSIWTKLTGLLLPLGISGFVFYQVGLLDPLLLGSGLEALEQQLRLLQASGYSLQGEPQSQWALVPKQAIRLAPALAGCYTLVLATGPKIVRLQLTQGQLRRPDEQTAIVSFCQEAPAALTAQLTLQGRGRYSWALLSRPGAGPAPTAGGAREGPARVRFPKGCLLRQRPTANSRLLGKLSPPQSFPVLERRGRWIKIQLKGSREGWAGCAAETVE